MKRQGWLLVLVSLASVASAADRIEQRTLESGGRTHAYALYVPPQAQTGAAPLLVLLHGAGGSGAEMINLWLPLAKSAGVILAGPDALDRIWRIPDDGPVFVRDLIASVKTTHHVDPTRVYLFGYSAGAIQALQLALYDSDSYAAVAVYAGSLAPDAGALAAAGHRIPIGMWHGTEDQVIPFADARATRDALAAGGTPVDFHPERGATHDYAGIALRLNAGIWRFLEKQRRIG